MNNYITKTSKKQEVKAYSVEDIAEMLQIGRTAAYKLVREGHFKTVNIGRKIRISKKSFEEWLDNLETE